MNARIQRLAENLRETGSTAFLAHAPITMGYLADFWESSHERFMVLAINHAGEHCLICPALSASQAKRAEIENLMPWKDGEDPYSLAKELFRAWDLYTAIVEVDDEMPARALLGLQHAAPKALFRSGGATMGGLMRTKDASELDLLRTAGKMADDTFDDVVKFLRPGLTELEVQGFLQDQMRARGGSPTFCIVGTGAGGAEPHHINGTTPLSEGDVVILDFGCSWHGYQSDITRTVAIGRASEEAHLVYETVYAAHMAARKAIHSGVTSHEIDHAARAVIEAAGFGPQFFHRTGHGIGLHGHEEPYIAPGNETVIQPGDCFSIEPGIYLEGKFGVRIENIVTATEGGHESLNAEPAPKLLEIG